MTVSSTSPTRSANTGTNGCVLWRDVPVGSPTVTVQTAGYVTPTGATSISQTANITAGQMAVVGPLQYDQAGDVNATFVAGPGATPTGSWDRVTFAGGGLTRSFGTVGTKLAMLDATGLFPFSNAYTAYAGDCTGKAPPSGGDTVTVTRGGTANVVVHIPAVNATVRTNLSGSWQPVSGAQLMFTRAAASGCPAEQIGPFASDATGKPTGFWPALPFGPWVACATTNYMGTNYKATAGVNLTTAAGWTGTVDFDRNNPKTGTCP